MLYRRVLLLLGQFVAVAVVVILPAVGHAQDVPTFSPQKALRVETLVAYIRPITRMTLSSEVPGRIMRVFADVGQQVPDDGVFALIDPTFAQMDVDALVVERKELESRIVYLTKEAERYRALVAGKHADQSTLDRLEQDLDQALLRRGELEVKIARAGETLDRHTVRAPSGFTVIERHIEPGEWVGSGQALAELGDYRVLVGPFALDAAQLDWVVRHRNALRLRGNGSYGLPAVGFDAWLHEISPDFDQQTRKTNVEIAFKPERQDIYGGMRVELDVRLPDRAGTMLVPPQSLIKRYEQYWLTKPDNTRQSVVLLGAEPDGRLRVFSPELDEKQKYMLEPLDIEKKQPENKDNGAQGS